MAKWRELMRDAETAEQTAKRLRERAMATRCPEEESGGWQCEEDRGHFPATPHRCALEW